MLVLLENLSAQTWPAECVKTKKKEEMFQMWIKERLNCCSEAETERSNCEEKQHYCFSGELPDNRQKKNKKQTKTKQKTETLLTWIVFGMSLLRPVPIESDSVLRRPTGAAVKQRFVCAVSIQRLCTERVEHKEKLTKGVKYTESHKKDAESAAQLEQSRYDLLPNVRHTKRLDSLRIINSARESLHWNHIQI